MTQFNQKQLDLALLVGSVKELQEIALNPQTSIDQYQRILQYLRTQCNLDQTFPEENYQVFTYLLNRDFNSSGRCQCLAEYTEFFTYTIGFVLKSKELSLLTQDILTELTHNSYVFPKVEAQVLHQPLINYCRDLNLEKFELVRRILNATNGGEIPLPEELSELLFKVFNIVTPGPDSARLSQGISFFNDFNQNYLLDSREMRDRLEDCFFEFLRTISVSVLEYRISQSQLYLKNHGSFSYMGRSLKEVIELHQLMKNACEDRNE